MMTHDEVLSAAEADPTRFGRKLRPNSLVPFGELTDRRCESLPPLWHGLVSGGVDDFYGSLAALWRRGCGDGAHAVELFERQLVYASFFGGGGAISGIRYVFDSLRDPGDLFLVTGHLPTDEESLLHSPDYGSLGSFCKYLHNSFESSSGSFVRHPSWRVEVPQLNLVNTMPTWAEFFAEDVEDREEPVEFTVWGSGDDDGKCVGPNPEVTVQYAHTCSDNFVEPGEPVNFWSFWNSDGEMQLVTSAPRDNRINALDDDLSYILRD
jgi:hypothetical protein